MNQPSYRSSGRAGQGGNPNVVFVFLGVLVLLLALIAYVWMKDPADGTLMAQLPAAVTTAPNADDAEAPAQTKTNPEGEALLEEVLAKPLESKEATKDSTQKPADQQLVPASGPKDSTQTAAPAAEEAAKAKTQFSGQMDYTYTVRPGDALYSLASKFKIPAASIREANAMPDNNLQAGQVLKIRIQGLHKVAPGEGLSGIARTYGVTAAEIRKANGLSSDRLQLGQELIIPVQ